jgi:hypothetical protein
MTKLCTLLIALPLALTAACGSDNGNAGKDAGIDATTGGPPDASCFTNPKTYNEIINACTDSVQVFKDSHPPLLNTDGTFPQLP